MTFDVTKRGFFRAAGAAAFCFVANPAHACSDRTSELAMCKTSRATYAPHGNLEAVRPIMSVTKYIGSHLSLLAIERGELDPEEPIRFSSAALSTIGSRLKGLRWGDSMPAKDVMAFSNRNSCNICAEALGEHLYGSRHAAVEAYTDFLRSHGLTRTRLASPSGINVGSNYGATTIREMVMMGIIIDARWESDPRYQQLIDPSGYQITDPRTIEVMSHVRRPNASYEDSSGYLVLGTTGSRDVPDSAVSLKTGSWGGGENNLFKFNCGGQSYIAGVLNAPHDTMRTHTGLIVREVRNLALQGGASPGLAAP